MIDLREQAGVAMNIRGQLSDPIVDPKVTLGALAFAGDLGRLLWRMKYGQDVRRASLRRASLLIAHRFRAPGRFDRSHFTGLSHSEQRDRKAGRDVERAPADIVERFAQRAIVEWVIDQCPRCEGRGVFGRSGVESVTVREQACPTCKGTRFVCVDEERIPFAAARNGSGPLVFREYQRCPDCNGRGVQRVEHREHRPGRQICTACNGTARLPVDEPARARALGVSLALYRSQWAKHFTVLLAMLDAIDSDAADTVRRLTQR